jgi:NTP pyrophosphatase (non-canonical NTP hydrolase)
MRKVVCGGALAAAFLWATGSAAVPTREDVTQVAAAPSAKIVSATNRAVVAFQKRRPHEAYKTIAAVLDTPEFDRLSTPQRATLLAFAAQAATSDHAPKVARELSDRAIAAAPPPGIWRLRMIIGEQLNDKILQRESLLKVATIAPDQLTSVNDVYLHLLTIAPQRDAAGEALSVSLAEALIAKWKPHDPLFRLDRLRIIAVRGRLADGRVEDARRLASEIGTRSLTIAMRTDRRFDGLSEAGEWRLPTPREASEAALATLRAKRALYPKRLSGVVFEAELLGDLNADAEAMAIVEAALTRAETTPASYDDTADYLPWLVEERGELLSSLDREDESAKDKRRATKTKENGGGNVSQTLNLAADLMYDQPKEALKLASLAERRPISAYGWSVALKVKVCAYSTLHRSGDAEAAYAKLLAIDQAAEAGGNAVNAIACIGDDDRAALLIIDHLRRLEQRTDILNWFQTELPRVRPLDDPREAARLEARRKIIRRPDVQAVLATYGRVVELKPTELWRDPPPGSVQSR